MTLVRGVMMEVKSTKKAKRSPALSSGEADADLTPVAAKTNGKYLRMILWACLSVGFLGAGALASAVLSQEEGSTMAILLFLAALAGAAGCLFCFYRFLREISQKPRPPFISTFH